MPANYLKKQFEEAPGYEGLDPELADKELFAPSQQFETNLEPNPLQRDDELRGSDEPLQVFEDEHDPTWSEQTRAYPDDTGFALTQILGEPTTTAGNGVITDPDGNTIPATAYRHVWDAPYGPDGNSPLTADVIAAYVEEDTFIHMSGCAAAELTLSSGDAGGVIRSSNGPALFWDTIADPSETPVTESLAIQPFMRSGLQVVTWEGDERNIENFDVGISNPLDVARSLGVASAFPDLVEKGEGPIVVTIGVPMRHLDSATLDALKAATRFAMKARWQSKSNIAATGYPYRLWLEGDGAQYVGGGPNALVNQRRIGASFDAKLTSDGAGASSKFTLVNATPDYTTVGS